MTTIAQDLGGVVLLPCPMCGGEAHLERQGHVACTTGWPCVHTAYFNWGTPAEQNAAAIAAWNRRTHSAEIAGALRDAEKWQPIESAPNGVWFLAHSERGWIGLARRADPDYAPGEGWFEDEHTEYLNPAWLTHWRPLPAPPTQDSAMQQGGGGGDHG